MNDELLQRLESWPNEETRSRLEPYRELILRWRRQGRSYRKIQRILAAECELNLTQQAIRKFVKLRLRPRKLKPEADLEMERPTVAPTPTITPATLPGKLTPEERERQRAILKALREKSVVAQKEEDDFPLWDPDKPLTNKPTSEEK
ncbi:MAG: hypothetical protein M3Y27_26555 [Acidobacteriota bacterium]|nr:hypothetical protein [Acidobacteriota bacterium]